MKKLFILIIVVSFLSGCGKDSTNKNDSTTNQPTTSETTTIVSTTTTIKTTTSSTTPTTKPKTTTKKLEKNQYMSSYDNKKHKYTYVYDDYDTCRSKGNAIFLDVSDNINNEVMVYNCEKVTDSNGKVYYGLFFYTDTNEDARFYY